MEKENAQITQTTKARRWCFTWHNYTKENVEYLKSIPANKADYIIFGFELCPKTNSPHLQGYIEFGNSLVMSTVKTRLDPTLKKKSSVHIESAYKNRDANYNYATKTETTDPAAVEIYGSKFIETTNKQRNQGTRTDWHNMHDFIKDKPDFCEFAEKFPEAAIKYHGGIDRLIRAVKQQECKLAYKELYADAIPKVWQWKLINEINNSTCKYTHRKITWIWSKVGNIGKSFIGDYMSSHQDNVAIFESSSSQNIIHAYIKDPKPIVIFDFTRSQEGTINYTIMESLINGRAFSPKYDSGCYNFASPKIVEFANWPPNMATMSPDRWDVRNKDNLTEYELSPYNDTKTTNETVECHNDIDSNLDTACRAHPSEQCTTAEPPCDEFKRCLQSRNTISSDAGEIKRDCKKDAHNMGDLTYSDGVLELSPAEKTFWPNDDSDIDNISSDYEYPYINV